MVNDRNVSPDALLALLSGRRSIRYYRTDPVPDEMIEQLLQAGRWAPSANNLQPWNFIVVRDAVVRAEIARFTFYSSGPRGDQVSQVESPVLIVLCGVVRDRIYHEFLNGDVAMAALQMMLQAKALGLGTCWVGGLNRTAIAGLLRIPESFEVVCLLTVGFPVEEPPPSPRRPLDEIVYYELYGRTKQGEEKEVLPGVPVPPPPGPREQLVSWLRRLFGRPL
jgi:nitroreductase